MFPSKHCCLYIPTNYKCFHCHQHEEHPRCQVARWRRKSPWQTSNSSWPGLKTQLNIGFHFWFSFVFLTPMTRLVKCPTRAMYYYQAGHLVSRHHQYARAVHLLQQVGTLNQDKKLPQCHLNPIYSISILYE